MNPLKYLKHRLATIPATSYRYRMVSRIWKSERVQGAKACTFYWVMLPASVLGYIWLGLFSIVSYVVYRILWTLFVSIGWLCGFTYFSFREKKGTNLKAEIEKDSVFYPYKFHPHSGRYSKLAPWHILVPALALYLLLGTSLPSVAATAGGATAGFVVDWKYVWLAVAGLAGLCYLVGKAVAGNGLHPAQALHQRWDAICPALEVEGLPPEETKELVDA